MPDRKHIDAKGCGEFEETILDSLDQTLSVPDRQEVETHVAGCASCRAFWSAQQRLDAALAANFRPSVLPANFKQRMIERAQAEGCQSANPARAHAAELGASLAELRKRSRQQMLWSVLDGIGYATMAGLAVVGGYEVLSESSLLTGLSSQELGVYAGTGMGAAAILVGWWIGFRDRIRYVLNWE